jgi:aldose 1-epimerase
MKKIIFGIAVLALVLQSCQKKDERTLSGLLRSDFQTVIDGDSTDLYVLKNAAGMEVCITNYGGRIVSVMVPDKSGKLQDVVLGFDSIQDYMNHNNDFGATIGLYANRINQGRIVIDGDTIQLPQNNFGHCLHGGPKGWQYQVFQKANLLNDSTLELTRFSADGDQNFPGNVVAKVTFILTTDNAIDMNFEAMTDKKTVINMCNHSYFNLSGDAGNAVTDDLLYINASQFTPVDSTFMTTGAIDSVQGTPMDFLVAKPIGQDINKYEFIQLKNGNGYDHNWVLNTSGDVNTLAAKVTSPKSGIFVEVYTNEPGIQVYTGNFLDGTIKGKKGIVYKQRTGICLETQHYPDSPNKPQWPSTYLEPGQVYRSQCIYKFGVEK